MADPKPASTPRDDKGAEIAHDTLSTSAVAKESKDKGPFVAIAPIRHGHTKNGETVETRYLPGESLDLSIFSQSSLDQLKASKSIGTKEELAALNKDVAMVGTGDDKTTVFDTPFVRATSIAVFLDGAATSGFNVAYGAGMRGVEQIKFTTAPRKGVVITAKADPSAFDLTSLEAKPKKFEK